jgi:hypothetical protein
LVERAAVSGNLGIIVPGLTGSICLLTVCGVYLWKQSFKLGGLLLSICGVVLLGLSDWQARSGEQVVSDLALQLGETRDAWTGMEAQFAQIAENQEQLAVLLAALNKRRASELTEDQGKPPAAVGVPDTLPPDSLEVEAIGGVSKDELDAVVAWIQEIGSERPGSVILIEPVMPRESADLDEQRKRLMNEAGRVMDHVFDEIGQRIEVARLSSDNVPGPRLRLRFEANSAWQRYGLVDAASEDRTSSLRSASPSAEEAWRKISSAPLQPAPATSAVSQTRMRAGLGAPVGREASQEAEQGLDLQGKTEWGQDGSVVITFAINSSYFPPGTSETLNSLISRMASGAPNRIQLHAGLSDSDKVAGATTPEDAVRYNEWLAERRMKRVKKWLTENAQDRRLQIEPNFVDDDSARRVVVRAIPMS